MEQENNKETKRRFNSHEEIKTREDLQDLLNSLSVKEYLKKMASKIGEIADLISIIRKDIKEFEKGGEIDREKLGKDINRLRFMKHELRQIKFGKFQELLTGEVDDYAKKRRNNFPK